MVCYILAEIIIFIIICIFVASKAPCYILDSDDSDSAQPDQFHTRPKKRIKRPAEKGAAAYNTSFQKDWISKFDNIGEVFKSSVRCCMHIHAYSYVDDLRVLYINL